MKFKKGTSGNPAGRMAGQTPGAKLRKAIEEQADSILLRLRKPRPVGVEH
jgi:hypothetical protein